MLVALTTHHSFLIHSVYVDLALPDTPQYQDNLLSDWSFLGLSADSQILYSIGKLLRHTSILLHAQRIRYFRLYSWHTRLWAGGCFCDQLDKYTDYLQISCCLTIKMKYYQRSTLDDKPTPWTHILKKKKKPVYWKHHVFAELLG